MGAPDWGGAVEALSLETLSVMLEGLPASCRKTVLACWEPFQFDDHEGSQLCGIREAASTYAWLLTRESPTRVAKAPHKVEKELKQLAASARDLKSKLEHLSQECLDLIEQAVFTSLPLSPSGGNERQEGATHPILSVWFQLRRGDLSWDGSLGAEREPFLRTDGTRPDELDALAHTLDELAHDAASRKQSPNGPRDGFSSRRTPLEWLLFSIGRMVRMRNGKITHIIPIARKVHEWATGIQPGDDWADRPFKRVKPMIKALKCDESDEYRVPSPRVPSARSKKAESTVTRALRIAKEAASKMGAPRHQSEGG